MRSMQDVDRWLRADADASQQPQVQRVKGALEVLMTKPAPRREAVRPLCTPWQVQQKVKGKDVELPQVREQLQQKVIAAANKLRQDVEQRRLAATANAEQPTLASFAEVSKFRFVYTCG